MASRNPASRYAASILGAGIAIAVAADFIQATTRGAPSPPPPSSIGKPPAARPSVPRQPFAPNQATLFDCATSARVIVRFLIHDHRRHGRLLDLFWDFRQRYGDRIGFLGFIQVRTRAEEALARRLGYWSRQDYIQVNDRSEFELPDGQGRVRRVRFSGPEGEHYTLADLSRVLERELTRRKR